MSQQTGHLSNRVWKVLTWSLFSICSLLILTTYTEYGITNDEVSHAKYGRDITSWYTSLFQDTEVFQSANTWLYGGFYDTITHLIASSLPFDLYETRHLINALTGLLGVVAVHRLGTLLGGPSVGFLAALLLILTPRYYGHAFNNPKDIPFAVTYIWSIYFIARSLAHLPRLPRNLLLKTGLAIGFTMGFGWAEPFSWVTSFCLQFWPDSCLLDRIAPHLASPCACSHFGVPCSLYSH